MEAQLAPFPVDSFCPAPFVDVPAGGQGEREWAVGQLRPPGPSPDLELQQSSLPALNPLSSSFSDFSPSAPSKVFH